MAIWQVSFSILNNSKSNCWNEKFWHSLENISKEFPEKESWCPSLKQYGDLESTNFEIDLDDKDILLRIDLRNITREQLIAICDFINTNNYLVQYENKIFAPNLDDFVAILSNSKSKEFLTNPSLYLDNLGQTGDAYL